MPPLDLPRALNEINARLDHITALLTPVAVKSAATPVPPAPLERRYRVAELAAHMSVDRETVRRRARALGFAAWGKGASYSPAEAKAIQEYAGPVATGRVKPASASKTKRAASRVTGERPNLESKGTPESCITPSPVSTTPSGGVA